VAWTALNRHPGVGVVLIGGSAFALASTVGVGEIAFATAASYAAWQVFARHASLQTAIREAMTVEAAAVEG
jgi:nucleoside phosphorylase